MADSATSSGATRDRRARRQERSRRRLRHVLTAVGVIVLVSAAVLVATDLIRVGNNDKPSLAGTARAIGESPVQQATTTTGARNCRPLSTDEPLRLWVGGDSLAGSLGPALGDLAGATGVVQPYFDSRVSSGLNNPGFFDWPEHATTEMARLNPEIVVFIIGTNDFSAVSGDWKQEYTAKVDSMMKTLAGPGRTVYWLGAPTLRDDNMDSAVVQVNAVMRDAATRHPTVHYVDTYKLFSDTDGKFSSDLPDETGKVVTMRAGDGVHLTTDGADYLAGQVYKLVDAQCGVTEQKVEGAAKRTIETEGSTQVAPGATSGSSGSSGGTIATTPPATAAPTTVPPTTSPPVVTEPPTTTEVPVTTIVEPPTTVTNPGNGHKP
jgi:hypothetical protein